MYNHSVHGHVGSNSNLNHHHHHHHHNHHHDPAHPQPHDLLSKTFNPISHQHSHFGYFCIKRPSTMGECYEVNYDETSPDGKIVATDDFASNNGFNWCYRAHCPLYDDQEVARISAEVNGNQPSLDTTGPALGPGYLSRHNSLTNNTLNNTTTTNNNSNPTIPQPNQNRLQPNPTTTTTTTLQPNGPIDQALMYKNKDRPTSFNVYDYYTNNRQNVVKYNLLHWIRHSIMVSKGNDNLDLVPSQLLLSDNGSMSADGSSGINLAPNQSIFKLDEPNTPLNQAQFKLVGIYNDIMTNLRLGGRAGGGTVGSGSGIGININPTMRSNNHQNGNNGRDDNLNNATTTTTTTTLASRRPEMTPFNNKVVNLVKMLGNNGKRDEIHRHLGQQQLNHILNTTNALNNSSFLNITNNNNINNTLNLTGSARGQAFTTPIKPGMGQKTARQSKQQHQSHGQQQQQQHQNPHHPQSNPLDKDPFSHICIPEPNHLKLAEQYFIQTHIKQFMTPNSNGIAQNTQHSLNFPQTTTSLDGLYQPLFNPLPLSYDQYTAWRAVYIARGNGTMVQFLDSCFTTTHQMTLLRQQLVAIICYMLTLSEYQTYLLDVKSTQIKRTFIPPFKSTIGLDPQSAQYHSIVAQNHSNFKRMCSTKYSPPLPSGLGSNVPTNTMRAQYENNLNYTKQCIQIVKSIEYLFPVPKLDLTLLLDEYTEKNWGGVIPDAVGGAAAAGGDVDIHNTTATTTTGARAPQNLNDTITFLSSPLKKKIAVKQSQQPQQPQQLQQQQQSSSSSSLDGPTDIDHLAQPNQWQRQPYKSTRPTPLQAIQMMTKTTQFKAMAALVIAIIVYYFTCSGKK